MSLVRAARSVKKRNGGDEGIRTLGLCVANASLSHLSYIPTQKTILNNLPKISTVIFTGDITTEAQRNRRDFQKILDSGFRRNDGRE